MVIKARLGRQLAICVLAISGQCNQNNLVPPLLLANSGQDGVEIALGHSPRGSEEDKERRAAIGQFVEVWLRRNDNLIANRPMSALNFSKAPIWFSAYFAAAPIFLKTDERKWGVEVGDKWNVVKLHP